jgi:hypothetical protein
MREYTVGLVDLSYGSGRDDGPLIGYFDGEIDGTFVPESYTTVGRTVSGFSVGCLIGYLVGLLEGAFVPASYRRRNEIVLPDVTILDIFIPVF